MAQFVDLASIRHLLPDGVVKLLEGDSEFALYEETAAAIVTQKTGIAPDGPDNTEPALVPIMAAIIGYHASAKMGGVSDVMASKFRADYQEALSKLDQYTTRGPSTDLELGASGSIESVTPW